METFKKTLSDLQGDTVKVMQCLSRLLMSNSQSANVIGRQMDEYLCELENICVRSRTVIEKYRPFCAMKSVNEVNDNRETIC